MIQIVAYWENAKEFSYGPYVACRAPFQDRFGKDFRIEIRVGKGTCMPFQDDLIKEMEFKFKPKPGWLTLEEITPLIEWLNERMKESERGRRY